MRTLLDRASPVTVARGRDDRISLVAAILVTFTMFASLFHLLLPGTDESYDASDDPSLRAVLGYTTRGAIIITGDEGFLAENSTTGVVWGSGTELDPYIIEGWDIDMWDFGIMISGTSVSFVIRDCYVHDQGPMGTGIYLVGCINGTITKNICTGSLQGMFIASSANCTVIDNDCSGNGQGIDMHDSVNIRISNNTCTGNSDDGISLTDSDSNLVENNNCSLNGHIGIYLDSSENNTLGGNNCSSSSYTGMYLNLDSSENVIWNNTCCDSQYGIIISVSSDNRLLDNRCSRNSEYGIALSSASNCTLMGNICSDNVKVGIDIWNSVNNTALGNNCSSNDDWGILLTNSAGNTLCFNNISDNAQYGVRMTAGSAGNTVWNNTFIHNNGAGDSFDSAHVQAYDDGTGNWWNNSDGYGNFWSDWTTPDIIPPFGIVDDPYDIDGLAGSADNLPLTSPQIQIPEFGVVPLVVLALLVALIGAIASSRRKSS